MSGNHRRGEKLLRNAIAAAARLQLPFEEGIAEYELVRHGALSAVERYNHLGCGLHQRKIDYTTDRTSTLRHRPAL